MNVMDICDRIDALAKQATDILNTDEVKLRRKNLTDLSKRVKVAFSTRGIPASVVLDARFVRVKAFTTSQIETYTSVLDSIDFLEKTELRKWVDKKTNINVVLL